MLPRKSKLIQVCYSPIYFIYIFTESQRVKSEINKTWLPDTWKVLLEIVQTFKPLPPALINSNYCASPLPISFKCYFGQMAIVLFSGDRSSMSGAIYYILFDESSCVQFAPSDTVQLRLSWIATVILSTN